MATKFKLDSKSDTNNAPPSYDASASSLGASDPNQSKRSSIRTSTVVLSDIRDLVTGPYFIPSSVAPIPPAITQYDDHSAMHWAIVNNRLEALSAFTAFISNFSFDCRSDLRLACIATSNHASFMQLNLGTIDSNYEPLRRSLGCPPDEIEVHEEDHNELEKHKFVALFRFKMCQKWLHITQNLNAEFVAGGG
ncbi:hypothetical protein K503DRAFT_803938 [Rhizopogon vinicolor AM-OR11-026]|uniref:Uncharacterized protein n=1 Tax=Rhizopogon vinicolor AM-OR11-026 TaxID=1314800 RepID=A0A1B7MN03_9AGAM|nr:hypothetical protein K503DRAFT_803938 [Rhizopogon vinicolor AM-OR11-026]